MPDPITVLLAEDDEGHAILVQQALQEVGLANPIRHFPDGQAILDFLYCRGSKGHREFHRSYLLLLDVRMPKINGIDVLRQIKSDRELKLLPVIMLTTTDDPREVEQCYELGCNVYVQKPIDFEKFANAIRRIGLMIMLMQVPVVRGPE